MEMLFGILNIADMKKVEGVQRRATKVILELRDKPYQERLHSLNLYSMEYWRKRGDMIQAYKILKKIDKIDPRAIAWNYSNIDLNLSWEDMENEHSLWMKCQIQSASNEVSVSLLSEGNNGWWLKRLMESGTSTVGLWWGSTHGNCYTWLHLLVKLYLITQCITFYSPHYVKHCIAL